MSENLFNSSHKATNDKYREGYDSVFGKKEPASFIDEPGDIPKEVWDGIGKVIGKDNKCQD